MFYSRESGARHGDRCGADGIRSLSNLIQHSADERVRMRFFLDKRSEVCDDGPKSSGV